MIRRIFLLSSLLLGLESRAAEAFPRDDDREGCDHMRGEEPDPGDRQRARELKRGMDRLCRGTDRKLEQLKKKYAASPLVIKRLAEFDPQIEAAAPEK